MNKPLSHIVVFWMKLISWLPFWMIYFLSDLLYIIIYLILGYRKKVVRQNLQNSFPEKSRDELKRIEKKFYSYMCDIIMETLKIPSISKEQLHKRCRLITDQHVDYFYKKEQSFIAVMGHHGNWEWTSLAVNIEAPQKLFAIYSPLKNKVINNFILKTRGKWGTELVAMKETYRKIKENMETVSITAFITDQTPKPKSAHWMTFLNQDTPVFTGAEKMAKQFDLPVIFVDVQRYKRGYYKIYTEIVTENPNELKEFELTERYTRMLELEIIKKPETWLWSHRRWKHKKPVK